MVQGLEITIYAETLPGTDMGIMFSRIHGKILNVGKNVITDHREFGMINFDYKWTAGKFDINRIDILQSQISRILGKGLNKSIFKIKLNYQEKGET